MPNQGKSKHKEGRVSTHGPGPDQGGKKSKKKGKTGTPVPNRTPGNSSPVIFNKVIGKFLSDKRFTNQQVTVTIDKYRHQQIVFNFDEVDSVKLEYASYEMSYADYMEYMALKARKLELQDRVNAWKLFLAKLKYRISFDLEGVGIPQPKVTGKPAISVLMSVLSPLEKDLMGASQKDWDGYDPDKRQQLLKGDGGLTSEYKANRIDYLTRRFQGQGDAIHPAPIGYWEALGVRHRSKEVLKEVLSSDSTALNRAERKANEVVDNNSTSDVSYVPSDRADLEDPGTGRSRSQGPRSRSRSKGPRAEPLGEPRSSSVNSHSSKASKSSKSSILSRVSKSSKKPKDDDK